MLTDQAAFLASVFAAAHLPADPRTIIGKRMLLSEPVIVRAGDETGQYHPYTVLCRIRNVLIPLVGTDVVLEFTWEYFRDLMPSSARFVPKCQKGDHVMANCWEMRVPYDYSDPSLGPEEDDGKVTVHVRIINVYG